jgi:hypothetical protein
MNRSRLAGLIASLAALLSLVVMLCATVPAQSRSHNDGRSKNVAHSIRRPTNTQTPRREYAPRIIGRANSFIIRGHITALNGQRLSLQTSAGARFDLQLDAQTTLMDSGELVSIATMDDITLRPADLRLGDEVEIVAERAGDRTLARILTRTASGQPVARR